MMHLSRIFKQKKSRNRVADELLAKISSQARDPAFFGEGKTADTLDGRFEIVTLHAVLVLRRLRDFGPDGKKLANTLYTRLFSQFDHALRETGVSDVSIARKMRQLGETYLGRARAYDEALSGGEESLKDALARNLAGVVSNEGFICELADYVRKNAQFLSEQLDKDLLDGTVTWSSSV